jgi:hypothetical protein
MTYDHYEDLRYTDDYHYFLFNSIGPKGELKKLVVYSELDDLLNGYNLGFGTIKINQKGTEYLDSTEISDNADRNKILATIALTVYWFIEKYPDRKVYLTGFNKVRTRLYQMAISHAYLELAKDFIIWGDLSGMDEPYNLLPFKPCVNYTGFLIQKR